MVSGLVTSAARQPAKPFSIADALGAGGIEADHGHAGARCLGLPGGGEPDAEVPPKMTTERSLRVSVI